MSNDIGMDYVIQAAEDLIKPWMEMAVFHAKLMLADTVAEGGKKLYKMKAHLDSDERLRRFFEEFLPQLGKRLSQIMLRPIMHGTTGEDDASQIVLEAMATEGIILLEWSASIGAEANAEVVANLVHSSYSLYRECLPNDTQGPLPPDVEMPAGRRASRHLEELRRRMITLQRESGTPSKNHHAGRGRGRPKGSNSRDPEQVKKIAEDWYEAHAAGAAKAEFAQQYGLTESELESILALDRKAKKNQE